MAAVRLFLCVALVFVTRAPGLAQGERPTLADAHRHFFNARYEAAAAVSLELGAADPTDLAAIELYTSALLFQIKAALTNHPDKSKDVLKKDDLKKILQQCAPCPNLMKAFDREIERGQTMARTRLQAAPTDEVALFFLGKLDLNHVWLYLGTLGRKTGWGEYWEARRSLDSVLERNRAHVRARVARAWIDYIVDTRMPWGTRWVLGGGNRKRALAVVQEAAAANADYFVHVEAAFALWDLQVRERNVAEAVAMARDLAREFPENLELTKFLERNSATDGRKQP